MKDRNTYEPLLKRLEAASSALPQELSRDWFASELFSCRSSVPLDYVAEIRSNIERLSEMEGNYEAFSWLSEKVSTQLMAFTQAIYRARPPVSERRSSPYQRKKQTLSALYQALAQHHEYERRLEENLREAQSAANSGVADQVIRCQQRLLRCQRAIRGIEEKIRHAEG